MSHEQASLVKAWTTLRGREVRRPLPPLPRWERSPGTVPRANVPPPPACLPCPGVPHCWCPEPSHANPADPGHPCQLPPSTSPLPPGAQVVALGRELLGGNGILSDFLVAKAFADMEAYYRCACWSS